MIGLDFAYDLAGFSANKNIKTYKVENEREMLTIEEMNS